MILADDRGPVLCEVCQWYVAVRFHLTLGDICEKCHQQAQAVEFEAFMEDESTCIH